MRFLWRSGLALVIAACGAVALAELTADHRKALTEAGKSVGPVANLIKKKEFDEAEKLIKSADEKIKSITTEAGVKDDDKAVATASGIVSRAKQSLQQAKDRADGKKPAKPKAVSFSTDVAPIISSRCLGCHGANNPRSGLSLLTFTGWRRGGKNGQIVAPGAALRSVLIGRLTAPRDQDRMPQGGDPLSKEQIETIATWINQGSRFDGPNENLTLDECTTAVALANFKFPKAKGTEKVSFTKDIAPFMANLCGGCHSSQRRSSGLSLNSYYDMMKGGDSGEVIIPGDKDKSRLFRLVGGLENPRMPANQSRITKKNYEDLVKWFEEGNTFDGTNPLTPLRTFVRSDDEMAREKFAKMTPDERKKLRDDRTAALWRKAAPKESMNRVEDGEFLIVGNAPPERLSEVQKWANTELANLKKSFRPVEEPAWKGRLAIFVMKDRFSYDEFSLTNNGREAPKEMLGHAVVTANDEDAYICLQDVGDEARRESPGLQGSFASQFATAFLRRGGTNMPDWLAQGMGLAVAAREQPSNPYFKNLTSEAALVAASVANPEDIFVDGSFSPATLPGVGYSMVDFLSQAGGPPRLVQFVTAIRSGTSTAEAAKTVYNQDLPTLARQYFNTTKKR